MSNLLVVDTDPSLYADVGSSFRGIGDSLHQASDCPGALSQLEQDEFDVDIIQVNIPDGSAHDLLQKIKRALDQQMRQSEPDMLADRCLCVSYR